jgi:hypothetical protein
VIKPPSIFGEIVLSFAGTESFETVSLRCSFKAELRQTSCSASRWLVDLAEKQHQGKTDAAVCSFCGCAEGRLTAWDETVDSFLEDADKQSYWARLASPRKTAQQAAVVYYSWFVIFFDSNPGFVD